MSALLTLIGEFVAKAIVKLFFAIVEKMPDWLVGKALDRIGKKPQPKPPEGVVLFDPSCGDKGIDLAQQRLLISSAFGAYFTGLLEREQSYINLKGQVEIPAVSQQKTLEPIQSVYWALQYPKGPQVVIIAAEGGMGKSTLAAKIIRCLYEEHAIDMILGDSAKTQEVDPVSGAVINIDPAYYSPETFYERICAQLGLPYRQGLTSNQEAIKEIQDRLEGRRAVIVADNLETVSQDAKLLNTMRQLATRDTRVIITTRSISGLTDRTLGIFLVRLKPISDFGTGKDFIQWHIQTHVGEHPDLKRLEQDIDDKKKVQRLLECTGGIPLLIQLVVSDIARSSWSYIDKLPQLFGKALLDFLYRERWDELGNLGAEGLRARQLLRFVSTQQYRGKKITFDRIREWAVETESQMTYQSALRLLQERFLIVNHDSMHGNFAVFPSLTEFLKTQDKKA